MKIKLIVLSILCLIAVSLALSFFVFTDTQYRPNEDVIDSLEDIGVVESYLDEDITPEPEPEPDPPATPELNYSIFDTTNEAYGIDWFGSGSSFEEVDGTIVAVERENVTVLVPEGYEDLAKAHVEDLITCNSLLSNFMGIPFPKDRIVLKIFISKDGSFQGSQNRGMSFYKRSQTAIDLDLQDVLSNSPDGFLYESSPTYCANTHELTHAFLYNAYIPYWANEGIAEYSQSINQGGVKDYIICTDSGYYTDELYDYYDLNVTMNYPTSMCMIQEIVETYGEALFRDMFQEILLLQTDNKLRIGTTSNYFVYDILIPSFGSSITAILDKYGIEEAVYER